MGFELQADADKVFGVLFKRFEKYGLSLHPEKTRRVPFSRPDGWVAGGRMGRSLAPSTFWDLRITGVGRGRAGGC